MTTTDSTTKQGPDLGLIADHLWAFGRTRALHAAIELGVFDALADGQRIDETLKVIALAANDVDLRIAQGC